ncbi:MAG: hypothetical protein KKA05_11810, partial [Alphaproteobacteria bacterium]|nr:hypothetical protein [Alphaproteobacteria bacterium]
MTIAIATLAFIPSAVIPFLYTKVTLLALGVLLTLTFFILARLTKGSIIVPPMFLVGALWLVPLAYALSTLFSGIAPATAFFGGDLEQDTLGFMVLIALLATLAALVFRRTSQYKMYFGLTGVVLCITLVVQILFVVAGKFMPEAVSPTTSIVGSFADMAMLAGLGAIAGLLTLRSVALSTKKRIVVISVIALSFAVLALANMIWVWILVALVALALFIEAIMHRHTPADDADLEGVETLTTDVEEESTSAQSLAAPLIALAISLFFLIGSTSIGAEISRVMGTSPFDVRPSWAATFNIGSHVYASSPLVGSGPSSFGEQWLAFRDAGLNETIFWNVDFVSGIGFIPTSFVTTGILGVLAWLGFIAAFLYFGLRALLFSRPQDMYVRYVSLISFTTALYVLVLSVFNVPGPILLALGFISVGIFISSLRYGKDARKEWGIVFSKSPRVGFVVVFMLTLLLLGVVYGSYVFVERYLGKVAYAEASNALAAGQLDAAAVATNRAILFAPSDSAYQLAAAIGIARMNEIASDTTLAASDAQSLFQESLSESISAADQATRLAPNNYQNWAVLGSVYQTVVPLKIDGAYENAKTAYDRAIALNPSNPTLPYVVAQLEIAHGNNAEAEKYLLNSIGLKRDYTQAIFLLSQIQVAEGRAREALEAA